MRPFRFLLFLLLLASALFAAPALSALEIPPPPAQWYTDHAGLLTPTEAAALNSKLQAFEQRSGAQFIIYVLPSLESEAIEDWTIRAVSKWKVGQAKYDNGLVLFVFMKERKIRTEVGYGLEGTITDAFSSRVTREVIAPFFQRNDYAGGLNAGADALMAQISKGEPPVEPLRGPQTGGSRQPQVATPQIPGWVFLLLFIFIFFVLPKLFSGGRRRRHGGCGGPGCVPLFFFPGGGGGITFGGGGGGFGGGFGGGGGGFSGGGGGFGGGGSTGGW